MATKMDSEDSRVMRFGRILIYCVVCAVSAQNSLQRSPLKSPPSCGDHVAWVAETLARIKTIKPGMTRDALLKVFTTEGGISTPLRRTFVSRDCPLFKMDVEFRAIGRPERDRDGRLTSQERGEDVIVLISKPYLDFTVLD